MNINQKNRRVKQGPKTTEISMVDRNLDGIDFMPQEDTLYQPIETLSYLNEQPIDFIQRQTSNFEPSYHMHKID